MIYFENEERTVLTKDRTILKSTAHRNPFTSKPGTRALASMIIKPLMTREKRPRVSRFIGKAMRWTIGLINILMIPRTTETTAIVIQESTLTPDCNRYAVTATAAMFKRIRMMIPISID